MLLLLAVAGVSLTATAVTWWNGHRTKNVLQEIGELEDELQQIRLADATTRRQLIHSYLLRLEQLLLEEQRTRDEIASELTASLAKSRSIKQKRFGAVEGASFQRLVLELELALSRVHAERAYLAVVRETIRDALAGNVATIPSPQALQLPNDYPREGGFVHFEQGEVPTSLHDYRLEVEDWSMELGGRAVLFGVDHTKHTARVSTVRCMLLDANLTDGGGVLSVKVVRRNIDGVHLDCLGVPLLLKSRGGRGAAWLLPEDTSEVYPEVWTLDETLSASRHEPLTVQLHPRVAGSQQYWSPILLSVHESMLPELVRAYNALSSPALEEAPWRIHLPDSGGVAFTLGSVTLLTHPDFEQSAFVLDQVLWHCAIPNVSVRFHAELSALLPGTPDDKAADRSLFVPFVEAIHAELGSQTQQLLQRRSALRLRKLSLIYQDQEEHLRSTGSCGFIVGEAHRGGRVICGTIVDPNPPSWISQALSSGDSRLRAVGSSVGWDVYRAEWIDRRLGTFQLTLSVPDEASFSEISPFGLRRLELAGEGSQQQTLSRALEAAILGRFASSSVHSTLLGLPGDLVENRNLGQPAVERLLSSSSDVVAIWGPPGTGKTTTLVKWLLSLFPKDRERDWPTVLLSAPTHVAVTKLLLELLMKAGRLSEESVRYGSAEKVEGTNLEPVWHHEILSVLDSKKAEQTANSEPRVARWAEVLSTREGREAAAKWLLGPRHIHAATCVGMARRDYGLRRRVFDIAVIDEAGKAFGAELLLPAAVARKLVLVGDHNQLPPTVTTDSLDEAIGYRLSLEEVEELLRKNMFHELFEQLPENKKGMLTTQYRMHEHIGSLVSELFYNGKLESHRRERGWSLTSSRVVFVDFSEVGSYRNRRSSTSESQENPTERAALHAILHRLSGRNCGVVRSILVICPYKAQRAAVEEEIQSRQYSFHLEATTVDAVQGGEADMVILLMTRSRGRVQFLLDRHRLNVALSRARDAVIILGHLNCLAPDGEGPIGRLIELGKAREHLNLIRLPPRANFKRDLAPRIIP